MVGKEEVEGRERERSNVRMLRKIAGMKTKKNRERSML